MSSEIQKLTESLLEILEHVNLEGMVFIGVDSEQQPYILFGGALDAMSTSGTLDYIKHRLFTMYDQINAVEEMNDLWGADLDNSDLDGFSIDFEPDFDLTSHEADPPTNDGTVIPFQKKTPTKH